MSTLQRMATCGAIVGFIFVSSGCVVAPDRGYDHDLYVREHREHDDRDHRGHERHCDDRDHDGDCRDRYR